MKVVVTGGAGYVGSVAVERLLERGDQVTVFDNAWRGHAKSVANPAEFVKIDLRDAEGVASAIARAKPDAVLHFAAATIVPESENRPGDYFAINVSGSVNLLNAMREHDIRRFIFSSTAAVYGAPDRDVVDEDAPLKPINAYGVSKHVVEQLLPAYDRAHGITHVIFRYFNVAGATDEHGEDHNPETHVIPVALQTIQGKRPHFNIFGTDYPTPDGTAIRDYVHIVDLVDAHLLALDRLDVSLGAFNLGARDGFSVRQIVDAVETVTGHTLPVVESGRRAGDPPVLIADSSRAQRELGWSPAHSTLSEMIGSAWDWMQRHPDGYR